MTALVALSLAVLPASALADGQLDPSFGTGGRVDLNLVDSPGAEGATAILPLDDGRFITVGSGEGAGVWVTQNLMNGALDPGFGTAGSTFFKLSGYTFASDAVRESSGSIVMAGGTENGTSFDTNVARM